MDRSRNPRDHSVTDLWGDRERSDDTPEYEIEPDSWRGLTEFVDQFDDPVFGVLADPTEGAEGFWIAKDIKKVRPAAVPIDQPPTFDLSVLGPGGKVVDEIRLTIEEIGHIRAVDPSEGPVEADDE